MKKLIFLVFVAVLAVGFGTAFADNTVNLTDTTTTLRVAKGPVVISDYSGTGTSLYVASGDLQFNGNNSLTNNGVSVWAIDTVRTDNAGLMVKKELTSILKPFLTGTTLIGAPVVATQGPNSKYIGVSVFFLTAAPQTTLTGNLTSDISSGAGMTLWALNGATGATQWTRGIAMNAMSGGLFTGTSIFASSPITIDTESVATSGATLYGTAGAGLNGGNGGSISGASVFAIDADTGALVTNGVTEFPNCTVSAISSVSGFFAAPVISGNSLYILGWNGSVNAVTMFAFDKNNLKAGVSRYGEVVQKGMDLNHAQMPTPAVSGASLYVVAAGTGGWAGVTVYDTTTLAVKESKTIGPCPASGVSASPVTNGNFIVLSTLTAVTCYQLPGGLSTNVGKWSIDLAKSPYTDGTYQIAGTPAISNGFVYIPVIDTTGATKGFLLKATLDSTTGNATKIGGITNMVAADPIVGGRNVYAVTYNPTVYQIGGVGADGVATWNQFKFGASKTGANTATSAAAPAVGDDNSGCFISTIK